MYRVGSKGQPCGQFFTFDRPVSELPARMYQEINNIIDVLKGAGNEEFAQKLVDALSISTIPSEILGESRIALEELSKTELPDELNIREKIEESLRYLNEIL